MQQLTYEQISAMKGNGSSMRTVLKYFIDMGATMHLVYENAEVVTERFFVVRYHQLQIPLRAYNLNFYSIYNSGMSLVITNDKFISQSVLQTWRIPTPETITSTAGNLDEFLSKHPQLVVKPKIGAHGDGISVGVQSKDALDTAVVAATRIHPEVLIQQQVSGNDHRLLFIDYEFVAAVQRVPATVLGDGLMTIRQLVEKMNEEKSQLWQNIRDGVAGADETRGSISKTPIEEIIAARGEAFLDTVPAAGQRIQVLDKANVSLGGQTHDVTDNVNRQLIDKISTMLRAVELPLCGVDVMSSDISAAPEANQSYVIELNAAPGLRLHELPTEGQPRQVCKLVAESLIAHYSKMAG